MEIDVLQFSINLQNSGTASSAKTRLGKEAAAEIFRLHFVRCLRLVTTGRCLVAEMARVVFAFIGLGLAVSSDHFLTALAGIHEQNRVLKWPDLVDEPLVAKAAVHRDFRMPPSPSGG